MRAHAHNQADIKYDCVYCLFVEKDQLEAYFWYSRFFVGLQKLYVDLWMFFMKIVFSVVHITVHKNTRIYENR